MQERIFMDDVVEKETVAEKRFQGFDHVVFSNKGAILYRPPVIIIIPNLILPIYK